MIKIMIQDNTNCKFDFLELEENQVRVLKWLGENGLMPDDVEIHELDKIECERI